MVRDIISSWESDPETADRVVHVETLPATEAIFDPLELDEVVAGALALQGIEQLYRHQVAAIRSIRSGKHTVIAAGTASGKSLCYQVPIAEAVVADKAATSLLLFPTKALGRDQFRALHKFGVDRMIPAVYDGDTDDETRAWVRRHANVVLTNPDMLHIGILPGHGRWATFFRKLEYVVVDEVHVLRGIFGSHVGNVLRRLRRLAHYYGSDPTFIACSATIGNPGELTADLLGAPVHVVEQDTSPTGDKHIVLWNPEVEDEDERRSALNEATSVFTDLVARDRHTIAFTRSRKGTELMYRWARERLDSDHAGRIAPYRAGYLAEERREVERRLFEGELLGVTATNALELGIDVGGLDAAVMTGFPGTVASFRQQAGRAGRSTDESLAVLVAGQDALDQWFMNHPAALFERPSEAAVINPRNPDVLASHIGCAAYEIPLEPTEALEVFGEGVEDVAADLVAEGWLRPRAGRLLWAGRQSPAASVDIRTAGGPPFTILDERGQVVGSVDEGQVFSQAHPGAVYLHQGDSLIVEELDLEDRVVRTRRGEVGYYTQPDVETWVDVERIAESGHVGRLPHLHGLVEVESHVVGFKKKSIRDRSMISYEPLDLPTKTFTTQALWFEVPDDVISDAEVELADLPGTLHAAEHTSIGMLPLFAICDRWDVGGLSTNFHPTIGGAVWFIYDGYAGGSGIAPIGWRSGDRHLRATLQALRDCPCSMGCPSCVQSPKCGNFNDPLDKAGAIRLLAAALG
jgi:DEAD/DEAH box helicase domain-containing protein